MKLSEGIKAGVVALTLTSAVPAVQAQDWTTEVKSAKTSEFRIPLLDAPALEKEYSAIEETIINKENSLFRGESTKYVPKEYTRLCGTDYAQFSQICKPLRLKHKFLELNKHNFNIISSINTYVNNSITPEDDSIKYGTADYWPPITYLKSGDCDKFVRLKHALLLKQPDIPPDSLNLAFVNYKRLDGTLEGHLVLLVTMSDSAGKETTFVLDSTRKNIMPLSRATHLVFISILKSDNSGWTEVSVKE